ncbi:MAG: histidine kinase [Oscillospiraceae bacterium]|nr:histidine kinase [Oscillospiraceae bacterium]
MKKISVRFTVWVSLPLLVAFGLTILTITFYLYTQAMSERNKMIAQQLELANRDISALVERVRSLHSNLNRDEQLRAIIYRTPGQQRFALSSTERQSLADILGEYRSRNTSLVTAILLVSNDGVVMSDIYSQDTISHFGNSGVSFSDFKDSFVYGRFFHDELNVKSTETLTYYGSYYNLLNYDALAYFAVNIRVSLFFSGLADLFSEYHSQVFVLDENMKPVYSYSDESPEDVLPIYVKKNAEGTDNRVTISGSTYLFYSRMVDDYPRWRIVVFVDYSDLVRQASSASLLVAAICLCTVCLLSLVCFLVARKITNPILRMNEAMLQMSEGIWPEPVKSNTIDEMHRLITGFNNMTLNVKKLTEIQMMEQEEKRLIEISMLQGKLALLQSQINPHFIHNTLNAMKYMALKAKNTELYNAIVSFNSLLRASSDIDNQFVTVREELDYLQNYINIQKIRYADSQIIYNTWLDPMANNALLLKLVLQPLVENALFHGILTLPYPGRIDVVILVEDSVMAVYICDNGRGIDPGVLEKLLDGTYKNTTGYSKIGLRNVMERIQLYYPDVSKFHISSQPGLGTQIIFKIPFVLKGEE